MLRLIDLWVGYSSDLPVLRNINLEVENGEVANFYGVNGIGKTTLLKTVATFLKPLKGSITYNGNPIQKIRDRIFFLPETVNVPSLVTGMDYVRAVTSLYGRIARKEEVLEALKIVNVPDPTLRLGRMSQGMKRRIQLSAALLVDAELFILDDPAVAIDSESKYELMGEILEILKEKGVVLMSSREPLNFCDYNIDLKMFSPKYVVNSMGVI
ncbi:multidrug ABC transporter ATP-binding protein [Thermococcus chitonophagus]|uniref:Multidrug ABC transporter ATP-binding protein n=1 Tax=Thermococcus chitonophagus TaxID=54262 RepID=A0A160VPX3_9EURY|nr:ABC transporter ATP-binding protein [Thermococcus chitonophagus]ASJ15654.1 multidrug ABC transporter ATP-binding protein [Thermococcus chitonophagus]CUX76863.1 Nitrate ABC transporter, ATP-binding protein [Thermococcus chitonophagus]